MQNSLESGGSAALRAAGDRASLQRAVADRLRSQTKPPGSLGQLESLGERLALLQNTLTPRVEISRICVFAGSHGIANSGVSAYPSLVTLQMVANFLAGGAAVCVLARAAGASLHVIDTGVEGTLNPQLALNPVFFSRSQRQGTRSFLEECAMTPAECDGAMAAGAEQVKLALKDGIEILAVGEMGIGNTTSAAALFAALLDLPHAQVVGRGTGIDNSGLQRKQRAVATALAKHAHPRPDTQPARHWLEAVGGYEIAAMAGAILAAHEAHLPVVVDGFISTAAALVAHGLLPGSLDVCFFSHQSDEQGHRLVLEQMGVSAILSLGMRLGEASGAALALPILRASARLLCEMATFESAGVSGPSDA